MSPEVLVQLWEIVYCSFSLWNYMWKFLYLIKIRWIRHLESSFWRMFFLRHWWSFVHSGKNMTTIRVQQQIVHTAALGYDIGFIPGYKRIQKVHASFKKSICYESGMRQFDEVFFFPVIPHYSGLFFDVRKYWQAVECSVVIPSHSNGTGQKFHLSAT